MHRVTEGDVAAKEAINFNTCGGTCEQNSVRIDEGLWQFHGSKSAEEEAMLHTIKCLSGISKDKAPRQANTVSIVNEVLHVPAIGKAGFAGLTSNLGFINKPRQSMLQGVSQTARVHFINKAADRDGAVVSKQVTWSFLVDERSDGDIPVSREGLARAEFTEHFNKQGDDTFSTCTLSSTGAVIIIVRRVIRVLTRRGTYHKELKELRGEAISARDSTERKASGVHSSPRS